MLVIDSYINNSNNSKAWGYVDKIAGLATGAAIVCVTPGDNAGKAMGATRGQHGDIPSPVKSLRITLSYPRSYPAVLPRVSPRYAHLIPTLSTAL